MNIRGRIGAIARKVGKPVDPEVAAIRKLTDAELESEILAMVTLAYKRSGTPAPDFAGMSEGARRAFLNGVVETTGGRR